MTPRQLLSILRLSQGLARLRLDISICHSDVDEAIRLTHASKSSLIEEISGTVGQEDMVSSIYGVIRDFANQQQNSRIISFADVEQMVVKKGYPVDILQKTIKEYQSLGILSISDDGTQIEFED
jgi:DNA replication licensing factor MCM7